MLILVWRQYTGDRAFARQVPLSVCPADIQRQTRCCRSCSTITVGLRLVKRIRDGKTVAEVVSSARRYAGHVRDIECASEAARFVDRGAALIRKNCDVPVATIRKWREACREYGSGEQLTDRKLANILAAMYKDVSADQIAEAVREARVQAAKAKTRRDMKKSAAWRRVAANLEAMRRSIVDEGCVPVPYP